MTLQDILMESVEALSGGDPDKALTLADEAIDANPEHPSAHLLRGRALTAMNQAEAAVHSLRIAAQLDPESSEAHASLATALMRIGRVQEPYEEFAQALQLDPGAGHIQLRVADFLLEQREYEDAERLYQLAAEQGFVDALAGLIDMLQRLGDHDAALELYERNPEAANTSPRLTLAVARVLRTSGRHADALELLESACEPGTSPSCLADYLYELGLTLDACGESDRAFEAIRRANELRGCGYDARATEERVERILRRWSPRSVEQLPTSRLDAELPVYVVGFPCSGADLLEELLAGHPKVHGAGELKELEAVTRERDHRTAAVVREAASEYLARLQARSPGALRVVDRLPYNFLHLGMAAQLFPGARVIHCTREAQDSGLSCYFRNLHSEHDYSTDLAAIGHFQRQEARLMRHWRDALPLALHEVRYEELVAEPERVLREVVGFLGLEWDAGILSSLESGGGQLAGPVPRTLLQAALGRARPYRAYLSALEGSPPEPLLEARGA